MSMINTVQFGTPSQECWELDASRFIWGRKIGRMSCARERVEFVNFPRYFFVKSDVTGIALEFRYNGIKSPYARGTKLPAYGEWLYSGAEQMAYGHLKIHVEHIAWNPNLP